MTVMYKRPIEEDGCSRVLMTSRARCAGCGQWISPGEEAFSYLPDPVDGNYVEHEACRYGTTDPDRERFGADLTGLGN